MRVWAQMASAVAGGLGGYGVVGSVPLERSDPVPGTFRMLCPHELPQALGFRTCAGRKWGWENHESFWNLSPDGRAMGSGDSLPSRTKTGGRRGRAGLGGAEDPGVFYSQQNSLSLGLLLHQSTRLQGQEDILWDRCFWGLGFLPFARVAVGWGVVPAWTLFIKCLSLGQVLCGPGPDTAGPVEPGDQGCVGCFSDVRFSPETAAFMVLGVSSPVGPWGG